MGLLGDMLMLFGVFYSSVRIISVSGTRTYIRVVRVDVINPPAYSYCIKPNSSAIFYESYFNNKNKAIYNCLMHVVNGDLTNQKILIIRLIRL